MLSKNKALFLPTIIAFALALRLAGIGHGLPFIFHPDEPTVVRTALSIRFFPNPGHFDWPHLYIYANYVLYMAFGVIRKLLEEFGIRASLYQYIKILWDDAVIYYYLARIFSAVLGAFTVVPIYLSARDIFGKRVGIFAALALALAPYHVWHSHYSLIDVPMMFLVSWSLYFSLKILRQGDTTDYAGAGFYAGLAASTKYNGGLIALSVVIAHFARVIKNAEKKLTSKSITNLIIAGISSVIAFLIGTPYALLDFDTFTRTDGPKGALWQFKNVGSVPFLEKVTQFVDQMFFKLPDDFGYTIIIGFFALLPLLIIRLIKKYKNTETSFLWFLLTTGLILLFYISGFERSRSHYFFVAYPFVIISFAYVADWLFTRASKLNAFAGLVVFMLLFGLPAVLALKNSFTYARNDTRVYLYNWLKENISSQDTLYYGNTALAPVADTFTNKKIKGFPRVNDRSPGYFVVSYQDKPDFTLDPRLKTKLVVQINNKLRLGPTVQVYSLNK